MVSFKEFMQESKAVNKWFIVMVFIFGGFAGALLTVAFIMLGFA